MFYNNNTTVQSLIIIALAIVSVAHITDFRSIRSVKKLLKAE